MNEAELKLAEDIFFEIYDTCFNTNPELSYLKMEEYGIKILRQYTEQESREGKEQHAKDFLDWVIDNADDDPVWGNESDQYYKDWQESDDWKSKQEERQ